MSWCGRRGPPPGSPAHRWPRPSGCDEVPYRATGRSWTAKIPNAAPVLVETFLQQIEGLSPDDLQISWLGLKLNDASKSEFEDRLYALINEFKERGPDAGGETYSVFTAFHPDRQELPASSDGTA